MQATSPQTACYISNPISYTSKAVIALQLGGSPPVSSPKIFSASACVQRCVTNESGLNFRASTRVHGRFVTGTQVAFQQHVMYGICSDEANVCASLSVQFSMLCDAMRRRRRPVYICTNCSKRQDNTFTISFPPIHDPGSRKRVSTNPVVRLFILPSHLHCVSLADAVCVASGNADELVDCVP